MARIALVWGLGADLGHITRYSLIAEELSQRGHQPFLILRDVSRTRQILKNAQSPFLQAPVFQQRLKGLPPPLNFTETLFRVGFNAPDSLASLILAWQNLFAEISPATIVIDHAPVAQLAAKNLDCTTTVLTTTFSVPPSTGPCPRYRFWGAEPGSADRLASSEKTCIDIINQALARLNQQPIKTLAELFHCDKLIFCERPEFDVYGERSGCEYIGSINEDSLGALPKWPASGGPKIFAYLKTRFAHLEELLAILSCANVNTIAFVPGLSAKQRTKYTSSRLVFSNSPIRLRAIAADCDYAICHGGNGTANVFADAGKPIFCVPLQMEQMMFSKRVEKAGLGKVFPLGSEADELPPSFDDFLGDRTLVKHAAHWAAKRHVTEMDQRVAHACDLIEQQL